MGGDARAQSVDGPAGVLDARRHERGHQVATATATAQAIASTDHVALNPAGVPGQLYDTSPT